MTRRKTIPDTHVLAVVRALLAEGGDRAVSFRTVGTGAGLAPSTLAQRFGSVVAMRAAALRAGWQDLSEATDAALQAAAGKGPAGLLKALDGAAAPVAGLLLAATDEESRARADDWRRKVETALAGRLGPGDKAREAAAMLFAAWQGQLLWGGNGFRIKDMMRRMT